MSNSDVSTLNTYMVCTVAFHAFSSTVTTNTLVCIAQLLRANNSFLFLLLLYSNTIVLAASNLSSEGTSPQIPTSRASHAAAPPLRLCLATSLAPTRSTPCRCAAWCRIER